MPDYWKIYDFILAILFGVVVGLIISLLGKTSSNRKRKSKTTEDPIDEFKNDFESISQKISDLQKELGIVQSVDASYDSKTPIQSRLRTINNKLNNILINYRKKISSETQQDKSVLTSNIEPTEDLFQESNDNTSEPMEHSVKEILFDSFEEQKTPQTLSSQITTLYNRGIIERSDRDLFWERFSITRIGNANAVAQRLGEVSAPDFREAGNGDFLAIESDNQTYYVVPLFDTTITPSAYNEGGIGYAFDCGNYDLQSARSILRVKKAAIFRCDGGQWFLDEGGKGELVLQN